MSALIAEFKDAVLLDGKRTPFVDYRKAFVMVSPIDLGIKAARGAIAALGVDPAEIGTTIAGSMAQASYDAYVTPRHIGLYAGVPVDRPAHLVQRICGTGIEVLSQAADAVSLARVELVLAVGTESMSRNPMASYTHRNPNFQGFDKVQYRDFLWEALYDPAVKCSMGDTAENLAKQYGITREAVDDFASRSFARAMQNRHFLAGEILEVKDEWFEREGFERRGIRLPRDVKAVDVDSHIRPSPIEVLATLKPAFGGVQTAGNSSAIVDGAGAILVGTKGYARGKGITPLARIHCAAAVGVPPEIMGIGPVRAIRAVLKAADLTLDQIDRIEINEAFGAQTLACVRELGIDEDKLNVNGGAIAIGHPLGATGIRLALTLARELKRARGRWGIASACIGGGQGIAMLIENEDHA